MNCPGSVFIGQPDPQLFFVFFKSNGCSLIWKLNRFQRTSDRGACNGSHTVLLPMILKTIKIGQINQVVLVDENHGKIPTVYWLQAFMRALFCLLFLFAPSFSLMPYYPYFFTLKCHLCVKIQKSFPAREDSRTLYLNQSTFPGSTRERSGSVVECLTRDRRAAGSSLTGVTALWSLSMTHLS